eukprot:jgi/Picre1/30708/NNA_006069.t1
MFCTLRVAPASSPNKSKAIELSDEEQARATLKRLGRNSSALDAIQGVGYLEGKTALVTGANSGIGKETARALYVAGCNVIIGCRNTASGDEAVKDIKNTEGKKSNTCTVVALDLSDLNSVLACARTIRETVPPCISSFSTQVPSSHHWKEPSKDLKRIRCQFRGPLSPDERALATHD